MTETEKREMLEAAARAFWGSEIDDVCTVEWSELDGAIAYTHADNQDHNGCDQAFLWDPLEDDGDCARLEAALGIDVEWWGVGVIARKLRGLPHPDIVVRMLFDDRGGDRNAARRAASVAVAAEIGRQMQSAEGAD